MTMTEQFRKVYADAVPPLFLDNEDGAYGQRELNWKGDFIPLKEAAILYAILEGGYNNFSPDMLTNLQEAFPDAGIQAAPARVFSVAVYLKIPLYHRDGVVTFIKKHWKADECDWEVASNKDDDVLRVWWD